MSNPCDCNGPSGRIYKTKGDCIGSPSGFFDQKNTINNIFEYISNYYYNTNNNNNNPQNITLSVIPNVGLSLTGTTLTTLYNTLTRDAESSVPVGGAQAMAASVWKTKTLVQVLDTILFPELLPTYTVPTLSFSYSQSGIKEVGVLISQELSVSGIKNDAGVFTSLVINRDSSEIESDSSPSATAYSSIPSQFGYSDPNNPNYSYTMEYTDSYAVSLGNTVWDSSGSFNAGLAKKNSKDVADSRSAALLSVNAPQSAGSLQSASATVTGIYPYFWGKTSSAPSAASIADAIAAGTETKVLAVSSGTVQATFDAAAEYVWFAHPASETTKTKWFNTALNQGTIGAGQFILSPVTNDVDSPDGYWSGVSYKIYVSDYATNTVGSIQLLNS